MIITKEAEYIINKHPYFKRNRKDCLLIDAIDFGEESYFLDGPFEDNMGLVYIYYDSPAKTFKEICEETTKSVKRKPIFYPYHVANKIYKYFGIDGENKSEYWYNRKTGNSISNIDIKAGSSKEGYSFNNDYCTLFVETENGLKLIKSILTEQELYEIEDVTNSRIEKMIQEMLHIESCKERPYSVYLCGNDDASWTKTFSTLEEAKLLILDLKKYGKIVVQEQMKFTN